MSRSALLALPSPRIHPAVQAAINARAGQIVGSGYTETGDLVRELEAMRASPG